MEVSQSATGSFSTGKKQPAASAAASAAPTQQEACPLSGSFQAFMEAIVDLCL